MYPYLAGSSYMLQLLPPWAQAGGLDALLARLTDPAGREALRRAVEDGIGETETWQSKIRLIGWGNVQIAGTDHPDLKRYEGKSLQAAAEEEAVTPFEMLVRCIELDAGQTAIVMFQLAEADLRAAFTHSLHMVGSDSLPRPGTRPHPRAYGSFPRVLGTLSRELGWFPIEEAVRRMTSVAAQRFGLWDRGLLRPGMAADLVLFDASIEGRATFDMPTELASGVTDVWVAGEPVLQDGRPTGRRPGRVLPGLHHHTEPRS
jgi:N-acyl-D-amino-acid deacylase